MSRTLPATLILTSLFATSPAAAQAGGTPAPQAQAHWPRLRELVATAELEPGPLPQAQLDQRVTSFAILREPRLFVLAGYLLDETGGSKLGPVHVWQFDGEKGEWLHAAHDLPNLGSVLRVSRVGRFLLLGLHRSPSATTDLVLTRDLQVQDYLSGRFVAALDERRIVVLQAQPHFAPIYETRLDVYDLDRRQGYALFPPTPPSPFRRRLMEAAAEAYAAAGEAWCNVNNHHCDASKIDSVLNGKAVYHAETDALAFSVSYSLSPLERAAENRRLVVYAYRGLHTDGVEYREIPLTPDAKAEIETYLSRETLDVLFSSPAASPPR